MPDEVKLADRILADHTGQGENGEQREADYQ